MRASEEEGLLSSGGRAAVALLKFEEADLGLVGRPSTALDLQVTATSKTPFTAGF